jgi:hypothetical protein
VGGSPGETALTRMPGAAYSMASELVAASSRLRPMPTAAAASICLRLTYLFYGQ